MKKIILIEGMMCGHCSGRVADALNSLDGVTATVSHAEGRAEVSGANLNNTLLKSAVEIAGYKVISIEDK